MNKDNSIEFLAPKIRETLEKGNIAEFETHGHSMIPLLHDGGDKVRLVRAEGPLKVGDVALCFTQDKRYVLHRVVECKNGGYILRGDNCVSTEFCSCDADVIGVACAFIRKGKYISVDSSVYRYYCRNKKKLLKLWQKFWKLADKTVEKKR